jgi:RimJ/RimL family protein N-acetyltransferase
MTPPTLLETARLHLRRPVLADAPLIFAAYAQDPEVTRYLVWRPHPKVSVTEGNLARYLEAWDQGSSFSWVITRKPDGGPIGRIELRVPDHRAELLFALARAHWGQGLMTEAAGAVVGWAREQPRLRRIWAVGDVENRAAARVLEKVGMEREGVLRRWLVHPNLGDAPRDCFCYALVK